MAKPTTKPAARPRVKSAAKEIKRAPRRPQPRAPKVETPPEPERKVIFTPEQAAKCYRILARMHRANAEPSEKQIATLRRGLKQLEAMPFEGEGLKLLDGMRELVASMEKTDRTIEELEAKIVKQKADLAQRREKVNAIYRRSGIAISGIPKIKTR